MQLNVLDKTLAVKNFFSAYAHNINGELNSMTPAEVREHLDSDIFIGCASAATGIPESDFVDYAAANAGKL